MDRTENDDLRKPPESDRDSEVDLQELQEQLPAKGHPSQKNTKTLAVVSHDKSKSLSDMEMLDRTEKRLQDLHASGRIKVLSGREVSSSGALEERDRLIAQRHFLRSRLGPTRVRSGQIYEIRLNGKAYSFSPYQQWARHLATAWASNLPHPDRPYARAERLIWLLWHFRGWAVIFTGPTTHKVRGPLVECVGCSYRHRYFSRPRDEAGVSSCRRCGSKTHREVDADALLKPFPPVTKALLTRRFRISRRDLEKILRVEIPAPPVGAIPLF